MFTQSEMKTDMTFILLCRFLNYAAAVCYSVYKGTFGNDKNVNLATDGKVSLSLVVLTFLIYKLYTSPHLKPMTFPLAYLDL